MKSNLFKGKSTRTKIFSAITVAVIILLIFLNLFVTNFAIFGNAYIDMTPEGLYTLRPVMVDACRDIFLNEDGTPKEQEIKMIFCNDRDKLIENTITRVVYYMAVALADEYSNFKVECVNVKYNPTKVSMYKTTSLTDITANDVIITCGSRYRIAGADSFWRILEDNTVYSYDGEFKLASILLSLTLIDKPAAYFVYDHGETIYDPENPESDSSREMGYFADLLTEKGFEIKKISLSETIAEAEKKGETPSIPDDCLLLIINNPTEDFRSDSEKYGSFSYVSETELVDRYLTIGQGSVMVAKDYRRNDLDNLQDFMAEWGIRFSDTLVKDETNCIDSEGDELGTSILGIYDTDESSYAYGIYGEYANLSSAPRMVITDTGHIECSWQDSTIVNESGTYTVNKAFVPFIYSSSESADYAKISSTDSYQALASEPGTKTLAALCARKYLDPNTGNDNYSYVFAAASAEYFSGELMGNASYANFDITAALIQDIARLDTYADMSLGGVSANNYTGFGGKPLIDLQMDEDSRDVYKYYENGKTEVVRTVYGLSTGMKVFYTVLVCIVPLAIATVGIIVCIKRKYL